MKATTLLRTRMLRTASVLAAGSLALAGLTACTTDTASAGPVEIEFWGWVPGLEDLVDTWNAENADIQVNFHRMTGDDGQKVEAAVDNGGGPDVVQLSTHNLPDYVIQGRVVDITEWVSSEKDNYTEASWAAVTFDGAVYGVPQGIGPAATMYRTDIFEQYGLEMPTTWDEYLETARALHAANPDVYIANMSPSEIGQWAQEIQQAESSWYGIEGDAWKLGVNDEGSQLVAKRWQTLLDEGLVTTQQMWTPEYWALVNAGTIATITYAAWFPVPLADNVPDLAGKWAVAPMPVNAGSTNGGDSGGAADIVLKNSEHPAEAAKFIAWLNGADETQDTFITVGGLFPSTVNGLASPALLTPSDFYGGQVVNEVFIEAAKNTPPTWVEGPNYGIIQTALLDEFAKVIAGEQTFLDALDKAQAAGKADLEARGLSVVD